MPWDVKSRDTKSTTRPRYLDHILQDNIRLLGSTTAVDGLVPDSVDGPVHHSAVELDDLLDGIALGEVDRCTANLLGSLEALGHAVNDIYAGGATKSRRVGCHETNGTGAEYGDGFSWLEARDFDTVPAYKCCQKPQYQVSESYNIPVGKMSAYTVSYWLELCLPMCELTCEKNKVGLMLLSSGECQSVEVGVRNADVLGLACKKSAFIIPSTLGIISDLLGTDPWRRSLQHVSWFTRIQCRRD